jgi:hypothetical protein
MVGHGLSIEAIQAHTFPLPVSPPYIQLGITYVL